MSQNKIETSAEIVENATLPALREVHMHPVATPLTLPPAMQDPKAKKSPAQWAYERVILYIQNFEKQLDDQHEIALGFVGGDTGVMKIEGVGYFDPDVITFYGQDGTGAKTQLIQHIGQLNVMLRAAPKHVDQSKPNRIGFRLAEGLKPETTNT